MLKILTLIFSFNFGYSGVYSRDMRPRTKTLPVAEQASMVLNTMISLGGTNITFRQISERLGTEDLTMFRQGLNDLVASGKIVQNGVKRAANYSLANDATREMTSDKPKTDFVPKVNMTPEQLLVEIVSDNKGYNLDELKEFLSAKFPGDDVSRFNLIKRAVRAGKITYVPNTRKARDEGYRCYFFPALPA